MCSAVLWRCTTPSPMTSASVGHVMWRVPVVGFHKMSVKAVSVGTCCMRQLVIRRHLVRWGTSLQRTMYVHSVSSPVQRAIQPPRTVSVVWKVPFITLSAFQPVPVDTLSNRATSQTSHVLLALTTVSRACHLQFVWHAPAVDSFTIVNAF